MSILDSGRSRWTEHKVHGAGYYQVYELSCIQLMYFGGFVMYLRFMYYRESSVHVLNYDLDLCPRPCYDDACGHVTCDSCISIILLSSSRRVVTLGYSNDPL